jgi:hypothetical protein
MDKYDFRNKLESFIMLYCPIESKDGDRILSDFDELMNQSITSWCVEDLEFRARETYGDEWEKYYDKSKFQENLEYMIKKHDASIGINWNTIDVYLENCRTDYEYTDDHILEDPNNDEED